MGWRAPQAGVGVGAKGWVRQARAQESLETLLWAAATAASGDWGSGAACEVATPPRHLPGDDASTVGRGLRKRRLGAAARVPSRDARAHGGRAPVQHGVGPPPSRHTSLTVPPQARVETGINASKRAHLCAGPTTRPADRPRAPPTCGRAPAIRAAAGEHRCVWEWPVERMGAGVQRGRPCWRVQTLCHRCGERLGWAHKLRHARGLPVLVMGSGRRDWSMVLRWQQTSSVCMVDQAQIELAVQLH